MTVAEIRARCARGVPVHDLIRDVVGSIGRVEAGPERLNAFISYDFELAVAAAADIEAALTQGRQLRLAGIPVAIKDNLCTVDYPTTCASRILANFRAPYDATVVRRLRAAGAVIAGKTNLDEFAMGSTTETSVFGRTRHPRDPERVTGGSSGGSAAAVAAGLVPLALGTDTAGSVRQPAAFCGIVGFKPTYGRVSRYGLIAHASSLDTVGILANRVVDVAELLEVIEGLDPYDATSRTAPPAEPSRSDLRGMVIGIPREYFPPDLHDGVRERCQRAIHLLERAGAEIRNVRLPHTRFAIPAYYALSTAEAATNLARYDGVRYGVRVRDAETVADVYDRTRTIGFGAEVKRRVMLGMHVLSEPGRTTFLGGMAGRARITAEMHEVFSGGIDLLFTPTTRTPAFVSGENSDPYELYRSDMLTVSANLAGVPAISIPLGDTNDLPVGGQLIGPAWRDRELLAAAARIEELVA